MSVDGSAPMDDIFRSSATSPFALLSVRVDQLPAAVARRRTGLAVFARTYRILTLGQRSHTNTVKWRSSLLDSTAMR